MLDSVSTLQRLLKDLEGTGLSANGVGGYVGIGAGRISQLLNERATPTGSESRRLDKFCGLARQITEAFAPVLPNFKNSRATKMLLELFEADPKTAVIVIPAKILRVEVGGQGKKSLE